MAPVQGPEIQFAQRLASNEKITRTRAIKKLRNYITVRSQKGKDGFTEEELLKLWKGLFYCLWMQDKPLLQEELSNNISCLLHNFQTVDGQLLYLETFLQTVKREWNGIDRLRMDKFFQLVRFLFRQTFEMLKKMKWEVSVVTKFLELLTAQVLRKDSEAPVGLQLHILDLYLTELAGVGAAELKADQNLTFIEPFCKTAAKTKDRVLLSAICKEIFRTIIDQAPFAVQDLLKELKAAGAKDSDSGQASEEDEEIVQEKTKSLKKAAGKQLNGTKPDEDEEDDLDDEEDDLLHLEEDSDTEIPDEEEDIGPILQFDYTGLADKLFQLASRSNTRSYNRQTLYKIIKMLRDLSEGVFPQDEYPDEVSTDEDDDMFGSRIRVKRVKRRKGEEVEDTRGPPAKKAKGKEKEAAEADEPNQDSTKDDGEPAADSTTTKKKKKKRKRKAGKTKSVGGQETAETEAINTETEAPAALSPPADSATDGQKEAVMETSISVLVEKPSSVTVTDEATPMETEGESEILLPLEVKANTESSVMVTEEPEQKKKKARKTKSVGGAETADTKAIDTDTEAPAALSPPADSATDVEKEALIETSISVLGGKPSSVNVTDEATPTETEGEADILMPLEVKSKNESSVMVMEGPNEPEPQAPKDKLEDHEEAATPTVMEGESETPLPLEEKATSVTATEEPSQPELQATEDQLKAQDQSETLPKKKGKRKKSTVTSVDPKPSELAGDASSTLTQDTVRGTEQPEITLENDTTTSAKKKKKAEKKAEEAVGEVPVEGESTEILLVSCEASAGETTETTITSVADTTTPDETPVTSVADTTTPGKKRNRKKSLKVEEKAEEVEVQVEGEGAAAAIKSGNCDSSTEDAATPPMPPIKTKGKPGAKMTPEEETSEPAPVVSEASTVDTMTTSLTDATTPAKKKKNKKSLKVEEKAEEAVEVGNTAAEIVPVICEASTEDATTTTPLKMKKKKREVKTQEDESELAPVISEASPDLTTAPTDTTTPAKKKKIKKSLKVEEKAEEAESQAQVEGENATAEIIPIICEASTEDVTIISVEDGTTTPAKKKKNKKSPAEMMPIVCEASTEDVTIISVEDATTTPAKKKKNKKSPAEMMPVVCEASAEDVTIISVCEASTEDVTIISVDDTTTPKKKKKRKSLRVAQEAESEAQIEVEGETTEAEIAPVGSEAPTEDTSTLLLKKTKKKKSKQDVEMTQEEVPTQESVTVETPPAEELPTVTSTMTPVKKKKKQKAAKTEEPLDEAATVGETAQEVEAPMEITMTTPVLKKKKKQKAADVSEVKEQSDADEPPASEVLSSSVKKGQKKNKRKIPVEIEFESDEMQAEQDAMIAKKPKLNKLVKEQSTPLSVKKLQKKKKTTPDSDFISFHSDALPPTPLFCKTKGKGRPSTPHPSKKGLPSTPHPSKMKNLTPKSDSKKVTFGLKNNKTAEFRKTDRSLLLSPEGLSRVPFDPEQKPRCGVLKSPVTSPTVSVKKTPKAKKSLMTTPKRTPKGRPTAADFF